jgi:hypothetical protein
MSGTPAKIDMMTIKLSAAELLNARRVAFIVSLPRIPFFLISSIAGFK